MSRKKPDQNRQLPLTWLWDLHPLAESAWPNVLGFNDGSGDGHTIDIRLWLRPKQMSNYPPPAYRPDHAPLPPVGYGNGGVRRCYVPQTEDLELVRSIWPDIANPANPSWPGMEAELIAAGRTHDELAKLNAPTLLRLAAATREDPASPVRQSQPAEKPGEWVRGVSKSEMARRLLGVDDARWGKVKHYFPQPDMVLPHNPSKPGGRMWDFRIDQLPAGMKARARKSSAEHKRT